jgi:hypothetical protein
MVYIETVTAVTAHTGGVFSMPKPKSESVAEVLREMLMSPNEGDANGEPAYLVDGLFAIAHAIHHLAEQVGRLADSSEKKGGAPHA